MSEWVDVAVYSALNVTIWLMLPAWLGRFTLLYLMDRNAEWVRTHRKEVRKRTSTTAVRIVCGAWGALSIAMLLLFQLDLWPEAFVAFGRNSARWEALKDVNSTLLIPGGIALMVAVALSAGRVQRAVPAADRRHAVLTPRTLNDFVSRRARLVVYALNVVVVAAWLVAAALGAYSTPKFWGRLALVVFLCGVFAFFVRISVRRPPQVMDRLFGPAFRAGEVRWAFGQLLLPPVTGIWRLYEEVTNATFVDVSRAMHLAVALLVVAWALRLMTYTSGNSGSCDRQAGATLHWSTP
jgi:hypothetical protein